MFQSAMRAIRYGARERNSYMEYDEAKFQSAMRAIRYGDPKAVVKEVVDQGFNPLCVQLDMVLNTL